MSGRATEIQAIRDQLDAFRSLAQSVPPEQLQEELLVDLRRQMGDIQRRLQPLVVETSRLWPEARPLREAFQAAEGIRTWLHPQAEERDLGQLARLVDSTGEALDKARPLAQITEALQRASFKQGEVEAALMADEPEKAHRALRQVIEMLQGVSRQVRDLTREERRRSGSQGRQ